MYSAVLPFKRRRLPDCAIEPYAVPGTETQRLQALQRAWRRDRWVASRRIAWRWLLWALPRYVLPVALALGALAAMVFWLALPQPVASANGDGVKLQLETEIKLPAAATPQAAPSSALPLAPVSAAMPMRYPSLKPDNMLKNKEP